jgi:hypothetical protein
MSKITIYLLVAFIVLKLTKVIDWSWFWVVSPAWIEVLAVLIIVPPFLSYHKKKQKEIKKLRDLKPRSNWEKKLDEIRKNRKNN